MPPIIIKPTTDKLLERLIEVVKKQHQLGNITDNEIKKFIELVSNTNKLKRALIFL